MTSASAAGLQEGGRPPTLLRVVDVVKDFPGLRALDRVSLDVASGEIVALVGHNGSGKSTLVKILADVERADGGHVELGGEGEEDAEVHVIHQDLGLISELSAVENLRLTSDPDRPRLAPHPRSRERAHTERLVSRFGDPFDVDLPVSRLGPAQRSIIAIARALDGWTHDRNVLILDEPTEALHASEVEILFAAVRRTAAAGAGVLFISHRLDEVLDLADRVVVLRNGEKVADLPTRELDQDALVTYVTGLEAAEQRAAARRPAGSGEVVLEVADLRGPRVHGVDLTVSAGEVVGVAGVLGSGRDTLPSLIFGALPSQAKAFHVGGRTYPHPNPRQSVRRGMAFVAGDRAVLGSVPAMNARENMTLTDLKSVTSRMGWLRRRHERGLADDLVKRFDVRPAVSEQPFAQFSGGNQQKIVFAKWLRNEPRLLVLEEPTQGVDVGAKQFIYEEIDAAAERGTAVLVCSSDAKELVRLCDRVLVMRRGVIAAELSGDRLTEVELVSEGYGLTNTTTTRDQEHRHA